METTEQLSGMRVDGIFLSAEGCFRFAAVIDAAIIAMLERYAYNHSPPSLWRGKYSRD